MYDAEQLTTDDEENSSINSFNIEAASQPEKLPTPEEIYLFKVCIKIEVLQGEALKSCDFRGTFLLLPIISLRNKVGKSVTFPLNKYQFFSIANPKLIINAVSKKELVGGTEIDISDLFKRLSEANDKCYGKYPIWVSNAENIIFDLDGGVVGEAELTLDLLCLGPLDVADCETGLTPDLETADGPQYDEFAAEINGHTLNIKILKKPGEVAEECDCICPCGEGGKNSLQGGAVAKAGSQILFQMPKSQDLCNKPPGNAILAYNVATCKKGNEHDHGNGKIKIHTGNSVGVKPESANADTFVLRLGKKSASNGARGRLELELIAPKPVTAEDFKKPSADKAVQVGLDHRKKKQKKKRKKLFKQ